MKYRQMRIQAYDHLLENLHRGREKEKELKVTADDAVQNEVRLEWVEHAINEHREAVKLIKKLTAAVETLRMPSSLDGKDISDWVRPIWRVFHYRNYWWLPVAFKNKWFFLRMKTRMIFFQDKRVFKIFNKPENRAVVENLSHDITLFNGLTPASQAIQSFPEFANGFLWDALAAPDQGLETISLDKLYEELIAIDPERGYIWIDGPEGSRYIYGVGRNLEGGETSTIHLCAGDSKRKNTLLYIFPGERQQAVYYKFRRPRGIHDERVVLFRRFGTEHLKMMWWSLKETPKAILKSPAKFQRTALYHLHEMDEHTVHPEVGKWSQEDQRGCKYRVVPL